MYYNVLMNMPYRNNKLSVNMVKVYRLHLVIYLNMCNFYDQSTGA